MWSWAKIAGTLGTVLVLCLRSSHLEVLARQPSFGNTFTYFVKPLMSKHRDALGQLSSVSGLEGTMDVIQLAQLLLSSYTFKSSALQPM